MPNIEPNLFTALRPDVVKSDPFASEVNCGVIMNLDGSYKAFAKGIDSTALRADPATLSADQLAQLEMGKKLMAISFALGNDAVMGVLMDLVANADVVDQQKVSQLVLRH